MSKWWAWTLCSSQAGNLTRLTTAAKYNHPSPLPRKCVQVVETLTCCNNRLTLNHNLPNLTLAMASKKLMPKILVGQTPSKTMYNSSSRTSINENSNRATSRIRIQKAARWAIAMAVKSLVHGMSRTGARLLISNHLTATRVTRCPRNVSDALLTKSIEDSYALVARPMAPRAALTSTRRTKDTIQIPWSKAKKACTTKALVGNTTTTTWANSTPLCNSNINKRITTRERTEAVRRRRTAWQTSELIIQIQHILRW